MPPRNPGSDRGRVRRPRIRAESRRVVAERVGDQAHVARRIVIHALVDPQRDVHTADVVLNQREVPDGEPDIAHGRRPPVVVAPSDTGAEHVVPVGDGDCDVVVGHW